MKKLGFICLLGLIGSLHGASPIWAQTSPAAYPFYNPQGPQNGTFGFPLYFGGALMTYNFRSGGTGSFNYGTTLPGGVSYTRGLGNSGSGSFAAGASTYYGNMLPVYGGGNVYAPFYAGPSYYLPTY